MTPQREMVLAVMHEMDLLQKTMRGHLLWLKRRRAQIEKARKEVEAVISSLLTRC